MTRGFSRITAPVSSSTEDLAKYPQLLDILEKVSGRIDEATMTELNYQFDEGMEAEKVAGTSSKRKDFSRGRERGKDFGIRGMRTLGGSGRKTVTKHPLRKDLRGCIGGAGYAVRCILEHQPAASIPSTRRVCSSSPRGADGLRVPGGGSLEICCTSPLTGAWGESRMGCDAGITLRKAGVDVLVVTVPRRNRACFFWTMARCPFFPARRFWERRPWKRNASWRRWWKIPPCSFSPSAPQERIWSVSPR
jgi:hypothetical protein